MQLALMVPVVGFTQAGRFCTAVQSGGGQAVLLPVQLAAGDARHSKLAGRSASAGQLKPLPAKLQTSATSHGPAAARHAVPSCSTGYLHTSLAVEVGRHAMLDELVLQDPSVTSVPCALSKHSGKAACVVQSVAAAARLSSPRHSTTRITVPRTICLYAL